MDCERVIELLPWYQNQTLEAAERADLEAHLEGCARCRAELRDTRGAFALFGGHVPTPLLVDYAFGRPAADRDLVEAHLADCPSCRAELELARDSGARLAGDEAPAEAAAPARPAARGLPALARAAAVAAAVLGLAGGLWSWQQLERQRQASTRIAALEDELRATGGGARLNVPIHDLWPESLALRGVAEPEVELEATSGPPATLILNSELAPDQTVARLELRDASGSLLESLGGPDAGPAGTFTLSLPLDRLPRGRLRILLYGAEGGEPLEVYSFELR